MSKISTFLTAVLGVVVGCILAFVAIVPHSGQISQIANPDKEVSAAEIDKKVEQRVNKILDEKLKSSESIDYNNLYKNVVKSAMPSVVGITTEFLSSGEESYYDFFFGPSSPQLMQGLGTGVIVDKSGYILTNSHVVQDGDVQKVTVLFNDGTNKEASVKWSDKSLDLALIKVDSENLPVATLGDSDKVEVGDIAVAIGNPMGLEFQRTVTQGIISGLERSVTVEGVSMSNLLQTDASINQGNSGGPLLNYKGEVIGINTVKGSGEGLGFSIPINTAKMFVDMMKQNGKINEKPLIGIKGISVDQLNSAKDLGIDVKDGVFVAKVYRSSPADKSGLKTGDVITELAGEKIKNMSDLQATLYKVGQTADKSTSMTYSRKGEAKKVEIKLVTESELEKQQKEVSPFESFFGKQ